MVRVLVTGAAGFIGSHTVERLLAAGHAVTALDNLSTGHWSNLPIASESLTRIEADVRDGDRMLAILRDERHDAVIHLAAVASVVASIERPAEVYDINTTGTLNVLEACRVAAVRRIVFASSTSIYGRTPPVPTGEDVSPAPASPYAASKAASEMFCMAYRESFGLESVILRYFNVYGPRQPADSPYSGVVAAFARRLAAGEPVTVHGDGEQTRDFIHVSDVAAINLRAALGADPGGSPLNAGSGVQTSILGVLGGLCAALGVQAEIVYGPERPGDVRHSQARISRLVSSLEYRPAVSLQDGLRTIVL
jgi:UDP-glucose 4-epimerase